LDGNCTPSSSHHDYPASDIACPIGTRFVAVTSGVVDYVSREDLWPKTGRDEDKGGLSVAIVGDDGVRYYGSHLSEVAEGIEPGVRVEAGQLLGLSGKTGNANAPKIAPHLHFGISHPTTPDDWQIRRGEVWPQKYLKAWKAGENVTPKLP
jgi:murein DD-endopeptidase MepM/ murein hydrolase activator NlpD